MRWVPFALSVLLLAGSLVWYRTTDHGPARAGHSPAATGTHVSPFEAFAHSSVGDWYAYKIANGLPSGEIDATVLTRITSANSHDVTRAMRGRVDATGETRDEPEDTFPRSGLTLERLTGLDRAGWKVLDLAISDDTKLIAGRSFPCKKLVFHSSDPMFANKRTVTELWLSPDVPAGGVVAEHEHQELGATVFDMRIELVGFGTAGATTWGTRPDGL